MQEIYLLLLVHPSILVASEQVQAASGESERMTSQSGSFGKTTMQKLIINFTAWSLPEHVHN